MQIIDPTQGRPATDQVKMSAERGVHLTGRVCLLSNSKPNASELLSSVARRLGLGAAPLLAKSNASKPAPDLLIQEIAAQYERVLVGVGD